MPTFQVNLSVTVQTALSVGGSGTVGTLADKSVVRDGWGRLILPGSQLKGRIRHACEALAHGLGVAVCRAPRPDFTCPHDVNVPADPDTGDRQCVICEIFGSPTYRSRLRFRDLIYEPDYEAPLARTTLYEQLESLRPGVSIDRWRGVAQEGRLYYIETSRPGTAPTFRREQAIIGHLSSPGHALLVLLGLHQVKSWGGGKSRGLGWAEMGFQATYDGLPFDLDNIQGREALRVLCT
jgi:CRISPR/Cas system CSM-associated protein Csm3 (group 7 of RAMP superfamily)